MANLTQMWRVPARVTTLADVVRDEFACWANGATIPEVRTAIRSGAHEAGLPYPSDDDIADVLCDIGTMVTP